MLDDDDCEVVVHGSSAKRRKGPIRNKYQEYSLWEERQKAKILAIEDQEEFAKAVERFVIESDGRKKAMVTRELHDQAMKHYAATGEVHHVKPPDVD